MLYVCVYLPKHRHTASILQLTDHVHDIKSYNWICINGCDNGQLRARRGIGERQVAHHNWYIGYTTGGAILYYHRWRCVYDTELAHNPISYIGAVVCIVVDMVRITFYSVCCVCGHRVRKH